MVAFYVYQCISCAVTPFKYEYDSRDLAKIFWTHVLSKEIDKPDLKKLIPDSNVLRYTPLT